MTSSSRTWAVLIDGEIQIRNTLGGIPKWKLWYSQEGK